MSSNFLLIDQKLDPKNFFYFFTMKRETLKQIDMAV